MRLVTFSPRDRPAAASLGILEKNGLINLGGTPGLPASMIDLLRAGPSAWEAVRRAQAGGGERWSLDQVRLRAPLVRPASFRDFYAFERHVASSFSNRGKIVPPEWYRFPVFYFSNPSVILGPDEPVAAPPGSQALDFELEIACVIGLGGRDIPAEGAERPHLRVGCDERLVGSRSAAGGDAGGARARQGQRLRHVARVPGW